MGFVESLGALLSPVYRLALKWDRHYRRRSRLAFPVISVGNIAMGGRAKTPMVAWLAKFLKEESYEPVILTRGYKRKTREAVWILPEDKFYLIYYPQNRQSYDFNLERVSDCGDEATELALQTHASVLVGADRTKNALDFLAQKKTESKKIVFILDDGFQHWSLERDYDLVLIKQEDRSGSLFPKGFLREEATALERAHRVLTLDKDILKRNVFSQKVEFPKHLCFLTTRAQSEKAYKDWRKQFSFENPIHIKLKDHASKSEMLKALETLPKETLVFMGLKEAVKLVEPLELLNYSQKLFDLPSGHKALILGLELDIHNSELIKSEIISTIASFK